METPAFFAAERTIDDEGGDGDQIAQLEEIGGDFEIPVEFLDLFLQVAQAGGGALEAFVGADNADVVPHQAADFIPIVVDHDQLVHIDHAAGPPFGELDGIGRSVVFRRFEKGPVGEDEGFEQRIAGQTVGPVQSGAGDLADGEEAAQGGLALVIGFHATALVVGGGHHGNGLGGDVDAEGVQMLSTGGMMEYAQSAKAEGSAREVIVATEVGMLYPLQQAAPDVNFIPANAEASCRYMKMITLEKLRDTLRDGSGEVKVEPAVAELARVPIERMVAINP